MGWELYTKYDHKIQITTKKKKYKSEKEKNPSISNFINVIILSLTQIKPTKIYYFLIAFVTRRNNN